MNLNLTLSCCFPLSLGLAVFDWAASVRRTWKGANHQLEGCCFTLEYVFKCKCHCDAVPFSYILIMLMLRVFCPRVANKVFLLVCSRLILKIVKLPSGKEKNSRFRWVSPSQCKVIFFCVTIEVAYKENASKNELFLLELFFSISWWSMILNLLLHFCWPNSGQCVMTKYIRNIAVLNKIFHQGHFSAFSTFFLQVGRRHLYCV